MLVAALRRQVLGNQHKGLFRRPQTHCKTPERKVCVLPRFALANLRTRGKSASRLPDVDRALLERQEISAGNSRSVSRRTTA